MKGQLFPGDPLFFTGLSNQPFGQSGRFSVGYHPANYISAEYIDDHIEVEIAPPDRAFQLGDIP